MEFFKVKEEQTEAESKLPVKEVQTSKAESPLSKTQKQLDKKVHHLSIW